MFINKKRAVADYWLQYDEKNLLGKGSMGCVFVGIWDGRKVAVKRVQSIDATKNKEDGLNEFINHPNVVKLLHVEDVPNFRLYALELCVASLDQIFLKDSDAKKYRGPLPTDLGVLFQLTCGLDHIHSKKLVYREVKPSNVLISSTFPVIMKWADFGLSRPVSETGSIGISGIRHSLYWKAPEILENMNQKQNIKSMETIQSDIFSFGCVLFYYFTNGVHPFGTEFQIPINIIQGNIVNFEILESKHFAREPTRRMMQTIPEERTKLGELIKNMKGQISPTGISEEEEMKKLGQNMKDLVPITPIDSACDVQDFTYGKPINTETLQPLEQKEIDEKNKPVFKGLFQGKTYVALKRYRNNLKEETDKEILMFKRDLELLQTPQNIKENFIRYFGTVTDEHFTYVATEWCEWCLVDLVEGKIKFNLTNKEILRQMAEAVHFVHSLGFIHRNLSPENFRINNKGVIKLTDFRFSRSFSPSKSLVNSGTINLRGWTAPECLTAGTILLPQVDVFILGCLFFYVFTGGQHPFGDHPFQRMSNMSKDNQECWINEKSKVLSDQETNLIRPMIKTNPLERPAIHDILADDYFKPCENYPGIFGSSSKTAGLCVIISQEKFVDSSKNDAQKLLETFHGFGYCVMFHKNLLADEIVKLMEDMIKPSSEMNDKDFQQSSWKLSLNQYPSLIVCILSQHGKNGKILGVDGEEVYLNQLMYTFNGHDCPAMIGKPKIFIVQTCQEDNTQSAIADMKSLSTSTSELKLDDEYDGKKRKEPKFSQSIENSAKQTNEVENSFLEATMGFQQATHGYTYHLPPVMDFLLVQISFIQEFCQALLKEYVTQEKSGATRGNTTRHLMQMIQEDLMAKITNRVQSTKQTELRSTLRKNIVFRGSMNSRALVIEKSEPIIDHIQQERMKVDYHKDYLSNIIKL